MTAVRVAVVILILAALIIAPRWPSIRDLVREQRQRRAEQYIRALAAEHRLEAAQDQAMRLTRDCDDPPCSFEDWFWCRYHTPKGRHHPPPLRYSPIPPSVHTITDLKEWK